MPSQQLFSVALLSMAVVTFVVLAIGAVQW